MKYLIIALAILTLSSCSETHEETNPIPILVEGDWLFEFQLNEKNTAPVNVIISKNDSGYAIVFSNAAEKIKAKSVLINGNDITIQDPLFDTWFEGEIINATRIEGYWYKGDKEYGVPFTALHGKVARFKKPEILKETSSNITGKWEVDFSKNKPEDAYKAIGQFQQVDDYVTGTFMTETGDYRFLEGNLYNNKLSLSCFDGTHLFLFKANLIDDKLEGVFLSGSHWA